MNRNEINEILKTAAEKGREMIPYGNVPTYIPELSKADKNKLGLSILTNDGKRYNIGDTNERFTIQSISKIITLGIALEKCGSETVFSKVDMEPSGEAFNSLIDLDTTSHQPKNPMVNSGALTVASLLLDKITFEDMLDITRTLCMDNEIALNEDVFNSEMNNISRNRAIAYLLESKGIIESDVEETLKFYTRMCSMDVTAENLATLGMVLASDGIVPGTDTRIFKTETVHILKTIMLTCGMYDSSGQFAVHVGIPTKSGVGGGLVSTVDKVMGIGIYSPPLDKKGNCIAGEPILEYLSKQFKLHIFDRHII